MAENQNECVCCAGPAGPQGIPGVQGPQGNSIVGPRGLNGLPGKDGKDGLDGRPGRDGIDGIAGKDGINGLPGEMGPQGDSIIGPMGPQGPKGDKGDKGDCVACPCHCNEPEFAEVFSTLAQDLTASPGPNLPGQVVKLENTIFATSNIDVSQAALNGKITVNKAGWYDVYTGMCGALNPIASPLPVWTLSLFKNGIIVPGSTFANMTLSPEQKSNEVVADVFVHCAVGDVLELANTSNALINLTAPVVGTNAQTNSAYVKIILLKAD